MADEENTHPEIRPTTFTLALRPKESDRDTMTPPALTALPLGLASPGISVEFHGDPDVQPAPIYPHSAPPHVQSFPSPLRHHRRTPSAHREIKETLNARSDYTNEDSEGRSHRRINQYVIKDEIGRGSYGAVHLATDQFGNEYAVKAFSKTRLRKRVQSEILRHGPRHSRRFPRAAGFGAPDVPITGFSEERTKEAQDALYLIREEVAIMKKLNHPNLVQLIEVLDDPEEDTLYMVLEMCKKGVVMKVGLGESATPYPEETCRYWFRDLILGIEYLHSQGVVHRDIKPDNLLLTDDDVLKIVDFGVSEMFEKATKEMRTSKSAGSPAFLPPELCVAKHGDVSGKAADIWSMGVSLYCLRYGRIPFERETVFEVYEAIRTETPKLPPDENPDFIDLMGRLMEKDPERRITMAELREHPWVTKRGTDPLLSAEENCSDPVDLPNPLELNHAFTRKMSHLIYIMKAISKFKCLLNRRPPAQKNGKGRPDDASTTAPQSPPPEAKPSAEEESTAEFAARVLRERQEFLANGGRASFDQLLNSAADPSAAAGAPATVAAATGHEQPPQPPPLLGIGTGGIDDFSSIADQPPAADVVSDSPTVVDFNVYDRAFEAEVERIKRSTSRRAGAGGRRGSKAAVGPGPIYQTRICGRDGRDGSGGYSTTANGAVSGGETENVAAALGWDAGERSTPRSLTAAAAAVAGQGERRGGGGGGGMRLADLVAQAMAGAASMEAEPKSRHGEGDGQVTVPSREAN